MAALNTGKVIKALEKILEKDDPQTFFFDFLKAYGFAKNTLTLLASKDSSRNIALCEGDYGLTKQIYFRPVSNGVPM